MRTWPTRQPAIAIGHDLRRDAFADRIGCRYLSQALFGYALNRLCIEVEETATPGGEPVVDRRRGRQPAAPLQTEVAVPGGGTGGTVTITQGQSSEVVPAEYTLLEQQLDISAPTQTASKSPHLHVRARRLGARSRRRSP